MCSPSISAKRLKRWRSAGHCYRRRRADRTRGRRARSRRPCARRPERRCPARGSVRGLQMAAAGRQRRRGTQNPRCSASQSRQRQRRLAPRSRCRGPRRRIPGAVALRASHGDSSARLWRGGHGRQLAHQTLRQHSSHLTPIVRRRGRAAHRARLLLHPFAERGEQRVVDALANECIEALQREGFDSCRSGRRRCQPMRRRAATAPPPRRPAESPSIRARAPCDSR